VEEESRGDVAIFSSSSSSEVELSRDFHPHHIRGSALLTDLWYMHEAQSKWGSAEYHSCIHLPAYTTSFDSRGSIFEQTSKPSCRLDVVSRSAFTGRRVNPLSTLSFRHGRKETKANGCGARRPYGIPAPL
jgi:hypothetical protein